MTAPAARILLVDDSPDTLEVLERNLTDGGYWVRTALSAKEAMAILAKTPLDLVITDMKMPGMSGLELVRHVREAYPDMEVMMITGYATIDGAVEAVKTGAEEYLSKPFTEEELFAAVRRSLDKLAAARARRGRTPRLRFGLVGGSESMRRAFEAMERAAASSRPVLILGESGTGREAAARAIHAASGRGGRPFLILNAAMVSDGPTAEEISRHLALAGEGTLYVRGVEGLRRESQDFLAGLAAHESPGPKIVASSVPALSGLASRGAFLPILYSVLSAEVVLLPPLRERGQDLLLLAEHFAEEAARPLGGTVPQFSEGSRLALRSYAWPGNLREMNETIAALVRQGTPSVVDLSHLPAHIRSATEAGSVPGRPLAEVEQEYIQRVLASVDGNKSRAAEILGIDRKTLREKLK